MPLDWHHPRFNRDCFPFDHKWDIHTYIYIYVHLCMQESDDKFLGFCFHCTEEKLKS